MIWANHKNSLSAALILSVAIYLFISYPVLSVCLTLTVIGRKNTTALLWPSTASGVIYGVALAIQQSKSYALVHNRKLRTRRDNIVRWIIEQIQVNQWPFTIQYRSALCRRFRPKRISRIRPWKNTRAILTWKRSSMNYPIFFSKISFYPGTKMCPVNKWHWPKLSSQYSIDWSMIVFSRDRPFRQEIHSIVSNLKTRCASIDWVKVISNDLVVQFAEHYQQVRRAT